MVVMVVVMVVVVGAVVMGIVVVEYMLDTSKRYVVFASVLHPEIELPTRWTPRAHLPT